MKTIPLSQGKLALVDDEDYECLSKYRWNLLRCRNVMYAQCHYTSERGRSNTILMHRLVMGATRGMDVDHRDQDGLNNQKSNLRVCSHAQNLQNMVKKIRGTSGFKGVYKDRTRLASPWTARIQLMNKRIWLGRFPYPELAAKAYNAAAIKHFGQYASLNIL